MHACACVQHMAHTFMHKHATIQTHTATQPHPHPHPPTTHAHTHTHTHTHTLHTTHYTLLKCFQLQWVRLDGCGFACSADELIILQRGSEWNHNCCMSLIHC